MSALPPIDLHAHVDVGIPTRDVESLQAVVFAVTRSLDEAERAVERTDRSAVWGVGCHPGLARAQMSFSQGRFADLLDRTPFAGELGLDGTSRVPAMRQRKTLRTALEVLAEKPRIVSLHSYAATTTVLGELEAIPVRGTILHWWLGEPAQTRRAIDLGCFFSINEAMVRRPKLLAELPLERVLTETDHPFGNRHSPGERRPGNVAAVELALAQRYGLSPAELRQRVWSNLGSLVALASCSALVPRKVRAHLAALR